MPARFERYRLTRGYNACINARQFRTPPAWPESFRAPARMVRAGVNNIEQAWQRAVPGISDFVQQKGENRNVFE